MEDLSRDSQNETARKRLMEIMDEAEEAKKLYPSLNLDREFENPVFRRLMVSGVPVVSAYELIHRDEVNLMLVERAVKQAEKRISAAIQSGAARPNENGASSALQTETDPRRLSKADRKDIKDRVTRGDRVYL